MEYREIEKVTTQTNEVFYLEDNQKYWYDVYIKERPELGQYKSRSDIDKRLWHSDTCIKIGPYIWKQYSISKDACRSHEYDYIPTLEKPILPGKGFYINQFYNDLYYIEEDYVNKYEKLRGFVFSKKCYVMHDLSKCIKIDEGMYRAMKGEFHVYLD